MEDDDLTLDPDAIETAEPATPAAADPSVAAEPAKPIFELAIDDRTKYTDPEQAKKGFTELRGDRDRHKTQAETLAEENRRLKLALGGEPAKPASTLTPEAKEKQLAWLKAVKPELGILTMEDLERPEVQTALEKIVEKREQNQLVEQGHAHVGKTLKAHGIELSPAKYAAFLDYLGGVLKHEESAELRNRFISRDFSVLDELIEEHFSAHIESKRKADADAAARVQADRDRRGRFAKVETAKTAMRTQVPAGPAKGGAAAVANAEPEKLDTPEKRKRRMHELLGQTA